MRHVIRAVGLFSAAVVMAACASQVPPSRLGDYLALDKQSETESLLAIDQRPLVAGLVLISDTAAAKAAPNLPAEGMARLGEDLVQDIGHVLPVVIKEVIPVEGVNSLEGNRVRFSELAKQHGLDYLVVVVASSTEQEYPVTLFLGWTTHSQPGYRRDNWSLLEFVLLDVKRGQTLLHAEARGWATLDRPTAPGINQWYPVVYLRPQDPERRFWPPTYEGAPNTLRVVSFNQAAKRLMVKLENEWRGMLEESAAARRNS